MSSEEMAVYLESRCDSPSEPNRFGSRRGEKKKRGERRRRELEIKTREAEDCTKREEAEEEEKKRKKLEEKRENDSEGSKGDRRRSIRGWSKNFRQRRREPRE